MTLQINVEDIYSIAEARNQLVSKVALEQGIGVNIDFPPDLTLVARLNKELVGLLYLNISDESAIVSFLVDPDYQRQGIGSQLLDIAIEESKKYGIPSLEAQVISGSVSERMLQKRNFQKTDYREKVEELTGYLAHGQYVLKLDK